MKYLKSMSERAKAIGSVKALLHKEVGGQEAARERKTIHASDLTREDPEYCPRETRLMEVLKKRYRPQWVPTALRVTFDDGWEKQERITNRYLRRYMVGYWVPPNYLTHQIEPEWSHGPPNDYSEYWYQEPCFKDPKSFACGGVDGLVKLPQEPKARPLEVKIMGDKQFRELKAPLWEHRLRTQLYLTLIAKSEHPFKDEIDTEKASVLYCLRGHGIKDENGEISPFKEYLVTRDDDAVAHLLDKAYQLTSSRMGGPMPDQICPHQMCSRAEKCAVSRECFSGISAFED